MIAGVPGRATMKPTVEDTKSSKVPVPRATDANTYVVSLDEIYANAGSLPTMRRQTSRASDTSSKSDCSAASSQASEASGKSSRSLLSRWLRR